MASSFQRLTQNNRRSFRVASRGELRCFHICAALLALGLAAATALAQSPPASKPAIPQTGEGMPLFDSIVLETIDRFHVPGASLAVVKDGRLVVAKGYGWANVARQEPVTPRTLF